MLLDDVVIHLAVDLTTRAMCVDQSGPSQDSQMPGHKRLAHT